MGSKILEINVFMKISMGWLGDSDSDSLLEGGPGMDIGRIKILR